MKRQGFVKRVKRILSHSKLKAFTLEDGLIMEQANKVDVVRKVAEKQGISQREARKNVDAVIESMLFCLDSHKKLYMQEIGSLRFVKYFQMEGMNPDGTRVEIPPHNRVLFNASHSLKRLANNKGE